MSVTSVEISLSIAFLLGIASALHCVGMCSGIAGGLSASLPTPIKSNRTKYLTYISFFNIGRILSYSLAGGIVGGFSGSLFQFLNPGHVHIIIHFLSTLILVFIAFYLMGFLPKLATLQKLGKPIWRLLEPIGRKLLPVKTLPQAFGYGAIWGWLPCGLVYSVLAWSLASGSFWHGALIMFAFGLGTFPTLFLASFLSTWLFSVNKLPIVRSTIGVTLIIVAFVYLFSHGHMQLEMS